LEGNCTSGGWEGRRTYARLLCARVRWCRQGAHARPRGMGRLQATKCARTGTSHLGQVSKGGAGPHQRQDTSCDQALLDGGAPVGANRLLLTHAARSCAVPGCATARIPGEGQAACTARAVRVWAGQCGTHTRAPAPRCTARGRCACVFFASKGGGSASGDRRMLCVRGCVRARVVVRGLLLPPLPGPRRARMLPVSITWPT
jgi:hypothetical protein